MKPSRVGSPDEAICSRAVKLKDLKVSVFRVPTDSPEADGTFAWDSTTLVLVQAVTEGPTGIGYSYAGGSAATVIHDELAREVCGLDCFDIPAAFMAMNRKVRNLGRPGVCSCAISAVDIALWDLKSKLLSQPLAKLLGQAQPNIPIYGSGGFTSYTLDQLARQLGGWATAGLKRVKMKIGTHPDKDPERVEVAREAIGKDVALFVDANGAYDARQALAQAALFEQWQVTWFEEPVSSDDLAGLRLVREQAPPGIEIAAGEYGYDPYYFRRMLEAGAVDVLQADATRCGGITGFMQAAALANAFGVPLSAHTAPAIHLQPCCATPNARHLEYFHDHVRIENMLFEGARQPVGGKLAPDYSRPGLGLIFKEADAKKFAFE